MAWQCSLCSKTFAKTKQGHHCAQITIDTFLSRQNPEIKTLLSAVLALLAHQLTFNITQSEKAITLYTPAHKSFLVLSPKKKWVDAWFTLAYARDHSLLNWIKEAWQLNH